MPCSTVDHRAEDPAEFQPGGYDIPEECYGLLRGLLEDDYGAWGGEVGPVFVGGEVRGPGGEGGVLGLEGEDGGGGLGDEEEGG